MSAAYNRIDMVGKRYGVVVVLSYAYTKKKVPFYLGRCECGVEKVFKGPYLRYRPMPSCGCKADRWARRSRRNKNRLPDGEAAMRLHYRSYRNNAKLRGYAFDLTLDQFIVSVRKPCYLCGTLSSTLVKCRHKDGRISDQVLVNGLDRVDNSVGYTIDNTMPCCGTCNVAKNNLTLTDFKSWFDRCVKERAKWPD